MIEPKDFSLQMVMFKKNKVYYKGSLLEKNGDLVEYTHINNSKDKLVTPDFLSQFQGMAKYACIVLEDIENKDLLQDCKQSNDVEIMLMASRDERMSLLVNRYSIESITFTGSERDAGVILSGKKTTVKNKIANFKTPTINFDSQLYGIEDAIKCDCDAIKEFTFEYIFKSPQVMPTLGFPEEKNEY